MALKVGKVALAAGGCQKLVSALSPESVKYRFNLGYYGDAVPHIEKAVELSGGKEWQSLSMLSAAYFQVGRPGDAVLTARRALDIAVAGKNEDAARSLRAAIERHQQTEALPRRD